MKLTRENLRILLVDDDELDCQLLKAALATAGFTHPLTHLNNGETAMEYVKQVESTGAEVPHIILLDINMPLINGAELLKRLREESAFRDLPVIMLSGDDSPAHRRETTHLGIFRFVKKQSDCLKVISTLDDFIGFYNNEPEAL